MGTSGSLCTVVLNVSRLTAIGGSLSTERLKREQDCIITTQEHRATNRFRVILENISNCLNFIQ